MKKTISLLLALVICLSLCACGGGDETTSKDIPNDVQEPISATTSADESSEDTPAMTAADILENAVLINSADVYVAAYENIIRAESEYDGKPVLFREKIIELQKDYIVVGEANTRIKVYLETEDIITLNNGQDVFVAGITSNITLGQEFSLPYVSMDMAQGYLVQNPETDNEPLYKNAKK